MAIQQLDLFAAFNPPPVKEKAPEVEAVVAQVQQPVIETEFVMEEEQERVFFEKESFVEEEQEPILPIKSDVEKPIVFADDKIAVKIKPRVAVQLPKPQPQPVLVAQQTATLTRPKSKRGRKSYKEIDAELDLIEIPEDEVLNQKMYYSITEVAKWFKVNASLLRYWENEFDILKPRKNRKGDRLFRPEDVKNLQVIYYLLRNRKFSLEGAKKYLRNNRQQADVNVQLAQSLTKFRSFLLELKANLGA
jgi:DNA-binding transcriptional MerR regulator